MTMILNFANNVRLVLLPAAMLALCPFAAAATATSDTNSWSLVSPDGQCAITVSLGDGGSLSYEVSRAGKIVIQKSPLGLLRDDQDFEHSLVFDDAGKIESRREKYELFAGTQPHVDHVLNHRSLMFRNTNNVPIEIELAAGDEGVAFRYRFTQNSSDVRVVESELTSFTLPQNARGWMQPYHAAGPYTPAYEDFFFHVSPGDPPPDSRQKPWAGLSPRSSTFLTRRPGCC